MPSLSLARWTWQRYSVPPDGERQSPARLDGYNVRVLVGEDGEPWFVAKDVAIVLGYVDPTNAIKLHCKGVVKHHPLQTAGGLQQARIIQERDVYRLVTRSKLPAAEQFEEWVVGEVLPAIRKTGRYQLPTAPAMPAIPQTFAQALRLAPPPTRQRCSPPVTTCDRQPPGQCIFS